MSLLKIFEGADDRLMRNECSRVLNDFVRELSADYSTAKVGNRDITIKRGSLKSLPPDLSLRFNFHPGNEQPVAQFNPVIGGKFALIVFDISRDVNEPDFDTLDYVIKHVSDYRDAWVHEYTHYLDWKRIGSDTWSKMSRRQKAKGDSYDKYLQDPIEQNAFFQQVARVVSDEITPDEARRMGINFFYSLFLERMKDVVDAEKYYRARQIPNLKKRVAQLYNDIIGSG